MPSVRQTLIGDHKFRRRSVHHRGALACPAATASLPLAVLWHAWAVVGTGCRRPDASAAVLVVQRTHRIGFRLSHLLQRSINRMSSVQTRVPCWSEVPKRFRAPVPVVRPPARWEERDRAIRREAEGLTLERRVPVDTPVMTTCSSQTARNVCASAPRPEPGRLAAQLTSCDQEHRSCLTSACSRRRVTPWHHSALSRRG